MGRVGGHEPVQRVCASKHCCGTSTIRRVRPRPAHRIRLSCVIVVWLVLYRTRRKKSGQGSRVVVRVCVHVSAGLSAVCRCMDYTCCNNQNVSGWYSIEGEGVAMKCSAVVTIHLSSHTFSHSLRTLHVTSDRIPTVYTFCVSYTSLSLTR